MISLWERKLRSLAIVSEQIRPLSDVEKKEKKRRKKKEKKAHSPKNGVVTITTPSFEPRDQATATKWSLLPLNCPDILPRLSPPYGPINSSRIAHENAVVASLSSPRDGYWTELGQFMNCPTILGRGKIRNSIRRMNHRVRIRDQRNKKESGVDGRARIESNPPLPPWEETDSLRLLHRPKRI